jgi:hypothetical protein
MKKVIVILISIIVLDTVFTTIGFAHGRGGCGCQISSRASQRYVSMVPPRPRGWPHILFAKEVIKSFHEKKLNVRETVIVPTKELKALPGAAREGIQFSVQSSENDLRGCVLSFKEKKNFEKIKEYYLDLNQKGLLHSWSFTKENILVVLDGTMAAEKVKEFKFALDEIDKEK